jgi:exopolysaccharide biosynthesis polyprenyl glycosylphosphotransferase
VTTVPADVPALDVSSARARARGLQRSEHRLLLLAGDSACGALAVVLALGAWSITTGFAFDAAFLRRSAVWLALVPIWTVLLSPSRRLPDALSFESSVRSVFTAASILLVAYAAGYFYAPPRMLPRLPALYFLWEAVLLTLAWRIVYQFAIRAGALRRRAIVVGGGAAADRIIRLLRDLSPDVEVVAAVDDDGFGDVAGVALHPRLQLDALIERYGASELIVASQSLSMESVHDLLKWQERSVAVVPMATEYEQLLRRVPVTDLPQDWVFTSLSDWVRTRDASNAGKRLVDIAGGLAGTVVLLLVLPFVALAIWLDSGAPILFRQRRLGMGGREFSVIKFRSMCRQAEEDGPRWADVGDARITRAGRWLRRSRLDEFPQVINVLRGEMSLVGPRPERPEFVAQLERFIPAYRARLMVRPGLTGWAQVNDDYAASANDALRKLEYDLYYIKHRSFLFDVWIVAKTVRTLMSLTGR